ncbi:hypothetical protein FC83_GL003227 [Agrilactobacillus composti DSM 18527 = JCM 14202]|jgi:Ca2+/Na+ antiporter|uniref:Uncharacterized protein n=1 Tax=Agrilactobacillus composti DSM 18527 = JCM 14202 TaxID=1423734 RepID=X0PNL0_9LACO|nr:DUF5993 family protein [Agrilactobacillus composti]KRM33146.1 hypothetical protein FC83_GL003227 [Agrilactobacillus composti DSM 18527 = JCM 14202]MCH4171383.1 DUF5993 family protein [Lactobacillus sp.]GAF38486.1 hypothetical protein JCM14202_298 [Agrilactobacillus composti DSM 18527 = JCM 14202]
MDIIIMLIITLMFLKVIIKGKFDKRDFMLWILTFVLVVVLFKLHATSNLNLNL